MHGFHTPGGRNVVVGALLASVIAGGIGAAAHAGVIPPQPKAGQPALGLTPGELTRFDLGKTRYEEILTPENGLGPIFNKESCGNCHNNPIGGTGSQTVTRFGLAFKGGFDPLEQYGGSLLQAQSIDPDNCMEVVHESANRQDFRVTNSVIGFGFVQAIPDADIAANETTPPLAGISGRVHWVTNLEYAEIPEPQGTLHAGRFGWKAQLATVLSFSADAALNEMGLTNRFIAQENDPNGILPPSLGDPDFCDFVADPEDGPEGGVPGNPEFIDRVTDFQRFLSMPPQTPKSGMEGEAIFNAIGCNACHVASFTTSGAPAEAALQNKVIKPYTDFLLHDIGQTADFIGQGDAQPGELRTPPLSGIRGRDPLWHNGSIGGGSFAERITTAIEMHGTFGSEARIAGVVGDSMTPGAWDLLSPTDQGKVITFLASLGQLEFDADSDNDVEFDDFLDFYACFTGPGSFYTPDDACAIHDVDQDGDVDADDYDSFLLAYEGPFEDCNTNTVLDITDVITGTSPDVNANGIPDECEICRGTDLDGNMNVGFSDLLILLGAWGPCPAGCPPDLDGDLTVGFSDLLILLGSWGDCFEF